MKLSRLQSLRRSRPAWLMALFAALLQLAMGMQSLQHQVGMAGQADLLAVCTPTGITWVAADAQGGDEPDPVPAAQSQCVVCAAAAFLPLLPEIASPLPALSAITFAPLPAPQWWPASGPPVGLPLARAPPQLS
ncbi:MAG: hypothetical protein QMC08_05695 [Brachymonas denitrificans]|uniref:DUF2946 family protein n=2 Tax=Brachymonas denitrificans TaxID=28220 RepID=UPI00352BEC22